MLQHIYGMAKQGRVETAPAGTSRRSCYDITFPTDTRFPTDTTWSKI